MLYYKSLANFSPQRYTLKSKCQRKINKKAVKINSTALVPRKEECKQMIYQSLTAASSAPALCIALSILFF